MYFYLTNIFSEWTTEEIKREENIIIEKETRYKWYKEEKELGGYSSDYPLIDYEDYTYTDFSTWSVNLPQESAIIEEKYIYKYKTIKPIRYIKIKDLYGSYDCFRITELKIKYKGENINYKPTCFNCSVEKILYLYNNIVDENVFYLTNNGYLNIDLINYYNINDLEIELYLYDRTNENKKYTIEISNKNKIYFSKQITNNFKSDYLKGTKLLYKINSTWVNNPEYTEIKETENKIEENYYTKVETYKKYRYKEKIYMHYKINKIYKEGYYKYLEGYKKDKNKVKTFYRYKKIIPEEKIKEDVKKEPKSKVIKEEEKPLQLKKEKIDNKTILNKINFKIIIISVFVILLILIALT